MYNIFKDLSSLIVLSKLDYYKLEKEGKVIEEDEGNFYNEKYVVFLLIGGFIWKN